MKIEFKIPMLNLQLFAEGGAGAGDGGTAQGQGVTAGAASQQTKGAKSNPLADVKYGIQPEESAPAAEVQKTTEVPTEAPVDLSAEFEELIKGKFKDQYNARVQDTIQRRLKGSKETVDRYNALAPTLEIMAKKYGVDATDAEALAKAIADDDSYFEQEALERGIPVKELKAIRKMEQENADLKRQMQEQQTKEKADKLYSQWLQQEQDTKKVYPSFNMQAEMQNPEFVNLLKANVDVRTAYEVLHKDEIIPAAMQFTAKTVEQKIAKKIAANGARPNENGMGSQSAAVVKSDVSKLTKYDIDEVARRVARGERVTFG
jgi:hypothetical protein